MLSEGDRWPGYSVSLAGDNRKYHIRRDRQRGKQWNVCITMSTDGPYWTRDLSFFAIESPGELVRAVNRVATRFHGRPGGSFYVNEYHQVLKPVQVNDSVHLRYVGEFPDVSFAFPLDDTPWVVGPAAIDAPAGLTPGDDWSGPRCGIPYWITRRGGRIYRPLTHWYEDEFVRRKSREYLDRYSSSYDELSQRIRSAKQGSGGRFYVNGSGLIFTPYRRGARDWGRRYLGRLWDFVDRDDWFPKTVPKTEG